MQKIYSFSKLLLSTIFLLVFSAQAEVNVGEKAPDFALTDSNGVTYKLSKYLGKVVVLEWLNHDCPFVVKHYKSGNMQEIQEKYIAKDIVWFSINSGSQKSGSFKSPEETNRLNEVHKSKATAVLIDETGAVGKRYGAKTTPHMFIIDQSGNLRYQGAIDSKKSTNPKDIEKSENYVVKALDAILEEKDFEPKVTKAYGCSVKY